MANSKYKDFRCLVSTMFCVGHWECRGTKYYQVSILKREIGSCRRRFFILQLRCFRFIIIVLIVISGIRQFSIPLTVYNHLLFYIETVDTHFLYVKVYGFPLWQIFFTIDFDKLSHNVPFIR